jgi:small conductance mechanosensitive channel
MLELMIRYGFDVLAALVILAAGFLAARWVGDLVQQWLMRQEMEPPIRMLMVRAVKAVVVLFAALAALEKFGVSIGPFLAGIGVVGLGVGLALQSTLSNVIAGLTIIFTKPYRVGEYIALLGVEGQVSAITIFSTTLEHADKSRVVIPNRKVVGEVLHNYGSVRQLHLSVGVSYGTDLSKVLAVTRELVAANPLVLREPAPVVGVSLLADSAITIAVQPWVRVVDVVAAQAELYHVIVDRFRAMQIEIPFPQHEVRLLAGS